jgi:5'/3'-nucleotidase SurE
MKVLVSNDDGIEAEGLSVLAAWAERQGFYTLVVAPDHNASGQSGAVTLGAPVMVKEWGFRRWAVSGTPADCVRVALTFLGYRPDVVLVGINHGLNLGFDVYVSGTVGAARYAAMQGIPAIAFSAVPGHWAHIGHLMEVHARPLIEDAIQREPGGVLSVNFPAQGGTTRVHASLTPVLSQDRLEWAEFRDGRHMVKLSLAAFHAPHTLGDVDAVRRHYTTSTYLPMAMNELLPSRTIDPVSGGQAPA